MAMSSGWGANQISASMSTKDQLSPGFDSRILPPQFKSQCKLQSAGCSHSSVAGLTVYRRAYVGSPEGFQRGGKSINQYVGKMLIKYTISWCLIGHLRDLKWTYADHLTGRERLIRHATHSFRRGHKIIAYRARKQYKCEHISCYHKRYTW